MCVCVFVCVCVCLCVFVCVCVRVYVTFHTSHFGGCEEKRAGHVNICYCWIRVHIRDIEKVSGSKPGELPPCVLTVMFSPTSSRVEPSTPFVPRFVDQ